MASRKDIVEEQITVTPVASLSFWLFMTVAGYVFVAGVLCLLTAMVVALIELQRSLQPVAVDRDFLLQMDRPEPANTYSHV